MPAAESCGTGETGGQQSQRYGLWHSIDRVVWFEVAARQISIRLDAGAVGVNS
jgi:hypothetical protein